jgi:spore coat polysaccharide biosynthesis protein SpsF
VESLKADGRFNKPELRLTLDYPEDYELISKIYSSVVLDRVLNLLDVIDYLEGNPQLAHINKNCIQLDLDERIKEEINKNFKENVEKIKKIKEEINPTIGK